MGNVILGGTIRRWHKEGMQKRIIANMNKIPNLYNEYYIKKNDERSELFKILTDTFNIKNGLYPGSFVHITPSFFISQMAYVDTDKRCNNFFSDRLTLDYIIRKKTYNESPEIRFHPTDSTNSINEKAESFDLLISLYSGFISKYCKKYLKKSGVLIVNNSHGDASLAYLDKSFKIIGVTKRHGDHFKISDKELNSYFKTKTGNPIDMEKIEKTMRGPGFTKIAYAYIFIKV